MENTKNFINDMFEVIDSNDWENLASHFHHEIQYSRPGFTVISGLADLIDFYRNRRIILAGKHSIEKLCASDSHKCVIACGSFSGFDRGNRPLSVRFCDVYLFQHERIFRRETFFNSPAV